MDTIDGMRAFAAVASSGSFTRAAERLGVSMKLVSKYVRQLENRLGVQLLNRTTRSVHLTDVGQAYFERCLALLDEFDDIESAVQDRQARPQGRIRMTAPTGFGEHDLSLALAAFLRQQPDIRIDLELTNRNVSLVEEGFDLAIRIGALADSSLIARRLAPMRAVICAAPEYLEQNGRPQHPGELAEHDCLIDTNFKVGSNWPFLIDGEILSVKVSGRFYVNTPRATCSMALAGVGITLCPYYIVGAEIEADRLEVLFADYEALDFAIYALYPHNRHLSARVRVLVDFLADWFKA